MTHYRAIFETIRRVCDSGFCNDTSMGYDSRRPIFIVGMPRTGTTLVEQIIASHPDVLAAGELPDFGLALKQITQSTSRLILDTETINAAARIDFNALGRDYIESTRARTGDSAHFTDKLPPNFLYAGFIRKALPHARIICLRRNPMDTCLSNYRQLFSTKTPYYDYVTDLMDTGQYYLLFDELVRHWEVTLKDNFCVVHYESVVSNLEAEARRLLDFCGLDWNPAVLRFHEAGNPVATASAVQVRKPLYSSSVNRWLRYESALGPLKGLLEQHGALDPALPGS